MLARFLTAASLVGLAVAASLALRSSCPEGTTVVCCQVYEPVSTEFSFFSRPPMVV
jgi:hypothetical protein